MSLVKDNLVTALSGAFVEIQNDPEINKLTPVPNFILLPAAQKISDAYVGWVTGSQPSAGKLSPTSYPSSDIIAGPLATTPLMAGLPLGLSAWWLALNWTGNGFAPVNPSIPIAGVPGLTAAILLLLTPPPKAKDLQDFSRQLAEILYTYTTLVQVTATTTAGAVLVLPVT